MTSNWISKAETAAYLGVTTRTIDSWRKMGYLPAPRYLAGRPRWNVQELDAWLSKQTNRKY